MVSIMPLNLQRDAGNASNQGFFRGEIIRYVRSCVLLFFKKK
jgi:hypothetical protein